jgi:hypothetical protein
VTDAQYSGNSETEQGSLPWEEPKKKRVIINNAAVLDEAIAQTKAGGDFADMQAALRELRRWAHRNDYVVEGPCQIRSMELTGFGKSNIPVYLRKRHRIVGLEDGYIFPDLHTSKEDRDLLKGLAPALFPFDETTIDTAFKAASTDLLTLAASEKEAEDWAKRKTGEWFLSNGKDQVGYILRLGNGSDKQYILFLRWFDGYKQMIGQPIYDVPLWNAPALIEKPDAPVMIHEGPKSAEAASRLDAKDGFSRDFVKWVSSFVHVGWHGSKDGIPWTDWSPLRGRRVLIWPDMDEVGLQNARLIARRLARLGNVVSYVNWEDALQSDDGWDLADGGARWLSRTAVNKRLLKVESPFNNRGHVLSEWLSRSFVDEDNAEVYQVSNNYRPVKDKPINTRYGPKAWSKIVDSPFNPYVGSTFLPGVPMGKVEGGLVNVCPPGLRAHLPARKPVWPKPTRISRILRKAYRRWFAVMIPDREQRRYTLERLALAIAAPQHVPQSMLLFLGVSGIGKGLLGDTMVEIIGRDRADAIMPNAVMNDWNEIMARKCFLFVQELHSADLSKRNAAKKWKELVGNSSYDIHQRHRDMQKIPATIHWFGATNERIPFTLERGNNRFYLVDCGKPPALGWEELMAEIYHVLTKDSLMHDTLAAIAKYLIDNLPEPRLTALVQRPKRQKSWDNLEKGEALLPWQQEVMVNLEEFAESGTDTFVGVELVSLVQSKYRGTGPVAIREFIHDQEYRALIKKDDQGGTVFNQRAERPGGRRPGLWCRNKDYDAFAKRKAADLSVFTFGPDK